MAQIKIKMLAQKTVIKHFVESMSYIYDKPFVEREGPPTKQVLASLFRVFFTGYLLATKDADDEIRVNVITSQFKYTQDCEWVPSVEFEWWHEWETSNR